MSAPANFASDNTAPAHPSVMRALAEAAAATAMPYGNDPWTERLSRRVGEVFEREVAVFPVATGTAANALALSAMCPPWGAVYGHPGSHAFVDECGAPEFYTGGAKLVGVPGGHGRIDPAALDEAAGGARPHGAHNVAPAAVTITQASEAGTVYSPDAIAAIAETARAHRLWLHMDGARFANAAVATNASPAELTWRAGVDVLSLGATKGGALAAEAVVFFEPALAAHFEERRKRGGHLLSKLRAVSSQMEAWLADDLWLDCARHANAMATRLADGLAALPGVRVMHPVEANIVFAALPAAAVDALEAQGHAFYRAGAGEPGEETVRLVAAWSTREGEVDGFLAAVLDRLDPSK